MGLKEILGQQNLCNRNNFGRETNFGMGNIFAPKKSLVKIKISSPNKILGKKIFGLKKSLGQKSLVQEKMLGQKSLSPKIFW